MEKTIEEMKSLANSSYSKAGYAPPPAHYPGNALEKESRTRAVTQLPLTLSTRAFFPTHDRAYERADEKSDELCSGYQAVFPKRPGYEASCRAPYRSATNSASHLGNSLYVCMYVCCVTLRNPIISRATRANVSSRAPV